MPQMLVSDIWPDQPSMDSIHIFVELPVLPVVGEHKLVVPVCEKC